MHISRNLRLLLTGFIVVAALFGVVATSQAPEPDVAVRNAKIMTDSSGKRVLRATVYNYLAEDVTDISVTFTVGSSSQRYEAEVDRLTAGDTKTITLPCDENGLVVVEDIQYDVRRTSDNLY